MLDMHAALAAMIHPTIFMGLVLIVIGLAGFAASETWFNGRMRYSAVFVVVAGLAAILLVHAY